jgi:hypothetical protein
MKLGIKLLVVVCLMSLMANLETEAILAAPSQHSGHEWKTNLAFFQDPTPSQQDEQENMITFNQLGYQDQTLHGPLDTTDFYFSLPEYWTMTGDAELELDLQIFGNVANEGLTSMPVSPTLAIYLNDTLIEESVLTESGPVIRNFSLPQQVFQEQGRDGRHQLRLFLHEGGACDSGVAADAAQAMVRVRSSSRMIVPHEVGLPPTNLGFFPRPIYQRSFMPDQALIVVPDSPSSAEMQAALSVAAGLGNLTDGKLSLSLINEAGLNDQMRAENHLIVTGRADNLVILGSLPLVTPTGPAGLNVPGADVDAGILQMVNSPWNDLNVVLVISGNTDKGVAQAGQAVSTGSIQPGTPPNLSVVTAVQPQTPQTGLPQTDRSFQALGYRSETLRGPGSDSVNYSFSVPPGLSPSGEAYIDLAFANSTQLDYEQSGISVLLNDDLIGSVSLSDRSNSQTYERVKLPNSAVRNGLNDLKIQARLIPASPCLDGDDTWLVVQPETIINLPLGQTGLRNNPVSLVTYPEPFTLDQQLNNTTFVLPAQNVAAWQAAAQLAFDMGDRTDAKMANLKVVIGDTVPTDMRPQSDVIMIGQVGELLLLDEIGDTLPVDFDLEASELAGEYMPVAYQPVDGLHPGYLLLSKSLWNPDRAILTILADSDQGLSNASEALILPELRNQLMGNFAIVTDLGIQVNDIARLASGEEIINSEEIIADDGVDASDQEPFQFDESSQPGRPIGVLLALIICILLIIVIIAIVAFPGQGRQLIARLRSR